MQVLGERGRQLFIIYIYLRPVRDMFGVLNFYYAPTCVGDRKSDEEERIVGMEYIPCNTGITPDDIPIIIVIHYMICLVRSSGILSGNPAAESRGNGKRCKQADNFNVG